MSFALTFPGQGSQTPGMGRDLADRFPAAKAVFAEVDDVLGEELSSLMWEGSEAELTLTKNAQPALMAVSMAAMAVLKQQYGLGESLRPAMLAGHSLGEYSALCAAGVISLADTARLLRLRGLAMQEAVPEGKGAMIALLGADIDSASALAERAAEGEVLAVANDNAPGQVVISGARSAVDRAMTLAPSLGIRRTVLLPTSAPFHCPLMQPAARRMAEALAEVEFKAPTAPIVANVTAVAESEPLRLKSLLIEQVTGVVRWRQSIGFMVSQGVRTVFEIGAGKVLTGLARRIESALDARAVGRVEDVAAFGSWLKDDNKIASGA